MSRIIGLNSRNSKDTIHQLGQLICMHGLKTNPDEIGVERLAISQVRPEYGMAPEFSFSSSEISEEVAHLMNPHSVMFCKGWTRNLCLQIVLLLAWQNPDFFEAG